jgi:integrase
MQTIIDKQGNRKFREEVRLSPTNRVTKLFARKKDAAEWKRKMLAKRDRREATGLIIDNQILFRDFVPFFLDDIKMRRTENTYYIYSNIVRNHLLPNVGNLMLKEIEIQHADKILFKLKNKGHNNKGINDILTVFKSILRKAVLLKNLSRSPLQEYKLLPLEDTDFNFWNKSEFLQFLDAIRGDKYYHLYLVAGMTGMRSGEACGLCWDMVNFKTHMIQVRRQLKKVKDGGVLLSTKLKTKSSKRAIPMNKNVSDALLYLKNRYPNSKYVFTEPDGEEPIRIQHLYRTFRNAQERAGAKLIRYHDLRHTFASIYVMEGGDLYLLSKLMGHATIQQTEKYAHLAPGHLRGATDFMEFSESENSVLSFQAK